MVRWYPEQERGDQGVGAATLFLKHQNDEISLLGL